GVEYFELHRGGSLAANVARIKPGAPVDLRPVLAHDVVGDTDPNRRWEVTSSMCRRVGGVVCINGDFSRCARCGQPFGGVILDGQARRSFAGGHDDLNIVGGTLNLDDMVWGGRLLATFRWKAEHPVANPNPLLPSAPTTPLGPREVIREVWFAGLNTDPTPDGAVLFTPDWGGPTPGGAIELVLATNGPVRAGRVNANVQARHLGGTGLPPGFASIVGNGQAAQKLDAFWNEWHNTDADEKHLIVDTATNRPSTHSMGGHPVLLRDGQRVALNTNDPKVVQRHPRTLVGYRPGGDVILMTVDGRRPGYSDGVTLPEAQNLLLEMGATHGINLDGGGSSTFVAPCPGGPCVVNRPSDGTERPVTIALAVVPRPGVATASVTPAVPPPPAAIAPPETPDPASVATAPPPPAPAAAPATGTAAGDAALVALQEAAALAEAQAARRASQLRALVALPAAPRERAPIAAEPIEADSPLWPLLAAGALLLFTSSAAGWRLRRSRRRRRA
ncbi:MAG: phosphodiester glycosidase family protein, partial [Acidimicrobiia bacterium]